MRVIGVLVRLALALNPPRTDALGDPVAGPLPSPAESVPQSVPAPAPAPLPSPAESDKQKDFEPEGYMTEEKARKIVNQKLPESQQDFDSRLGMLKSTAVFQLGKIDRQIPVALLNDNGDVQAMTGQPPITLVDCADQLKEFAVDKTNDLKQIHEDIKKMKGTVVDFQLIDDMAEDPSHPWIHSATYNKTSVSRKKDAVTKLLQTWIKSMNKALEQAAMEYIPPFSAQLRNVSEDDRPPPAAMAWIEGYTQSERLVMVMAQLLKKFSAKGMAEGLRISSAPLAPPLNAKDYLDILQLASRQVGANIKTALAKGLSGRPEKAVSLLEVNNGLVDSHFSDVEASLEKLREVVLKEKKAMKVGLLPKASSLLLAYGQAVNALNNANNATREALSLPPTFISRRSSLAEVYSAILHGDMAKAFYGRKLLSNETIEDWGLKSHRDAEGTLSFVQEGSVEDAKQKASDDAYNTLRKEFDERVPAVAAYNETEYLAHFKQRGAGADVPQRLQALFDKIKAGKAYKEEPEPS